ncbi:hypothetical protein PR048_020172 [Dryococelus australis]|uniref:Uncharacterized protein n=1 Tax=Dryococelus australis TaxID=614101 RepID=A0ABQ9H5K5_9NEOP|nr:hypothetical protein PR048_020172 [Dryococelus australis]
MNWLYSCVRESRQDLCVGLLSHGGAAKMVRQHWDVLLHTVPGRTLCDTEKWPALPNKMELDNGNVSKQLSDNDDLNELYQNYRPIETEPKDNVGEESDDGSRPSKYVKRHQVNPSTWKAAKMVFVQYLTRKANTARARDREANAASRRKNSCNYYLKKGYNIVRIRKTTFSHMLAIGEWTALNWQKDYDSKEDDSTDDDGLATENEPTEPSSKKLRKPKERYSGRRVDCRLGRHERDEDEASCRLASQLSRMADNDVDGAPQLPTPLLPLTNSQSSFQPPTASTTEMLCYRSPFLPSTAHRAHSNLRLRRINSYYIVP